MDYQDFTVISRAEGGEFHCRFRTLTRGIAPRHSDTADIQFMVGGKAVTVALPMTAFTDFRERHGRVITDLESIQVAGRILKDFIEREILPEDRCLTPSHEQALHIAEILTGAKSENSRLGPRMVQKAAR